MTRSVVRVRLSGKQATWNIQACHFQQLQKKFAMLCIVYSCGDGGQKHSYMEQAQSFLGS